MPTIRDVARESGVSVATVSYVLNGGPRPVGEKTRRHVLETVRRLGYHPSALARALNSGRVHTLGVRFGNIEPAIVSNEYVTGVLSGVMSAAAEHRYNVTLFTQPWQGAASARQHSDGRTDGILLIAPPLDSDVVEHLADLKTPLVVVSSAANAHGRTPYVDVDNEKGARLATEHLLALGHRRIAHLMGSDNQSSVAERRAGFLGAMRRAGIEVPPEYLAAGRYQLQMGLEPARRLLSLPERPTAVFAGNDALALAVLAVAREMGLHVPSQLSVVGFDDVPSSALVTPPLTTIRQPLARMGEWATRLLVAQIEGSQPLALEKRTEPELVIRGSTAAAPGREDSGHCPHPQTMFLKGEPQ